MEVTTVADFSDGSNGLTYTAFRKMLETFLNHFYAAHQLPQERYLQIHGDQKVTSKTLWKGEITDMDFTYYLDCTISVLAGQL